MSKLVVPKLVENVRNHKSPDVDFSFEKVISHSQITIENNCPYQWKLRYKDKIKPFSDSIHTIFGKAIHETIQLYLHERFMVSKVKSDNMDLLEIFKNIIREEYKKSYKKNNKKHFLDAEILQEFAKDGEKILFDFKDKINYYFNLEEWLFCGYELPINITPVDDIKNIKYIGYLDLVFYNVVEKKFYVIDIKTSGKGWTDKREKKDFMKQAQLILYKKYFSQQYKIPIDQVEVEFFIVKRKLWENSKYPQKRVQKFIPSSGRNNLAKAEKLVVDFVVNNFEEDGQIKDKEYDKNPSKSNCHFCPFLNSKYCSEGIS